MKKIIAIALICWCGAVAVNVTSRRIYPLEYLEDLRFVPERESIEILSLDHRGQRQQSNKSRYQDYV